MSVSGFYARARAPREPSPLISSTPGQEQDFSLRTCLPFLWPRRRRASGSLYPRCAHFWVSTPLELGTVFTRLGSTCAKGKQEVDLTQHTAERGPEPNTVLNSRRCVWQATLRR